MAEDAIWTLEESLWTGDAQRYHELVGDDCVMVLPAAPFIMSGEEAIEAVASTPRWSGVRFSEERSAQPREDVVVIAYRATAEREGADAYEAYCTTTWHRVSDQDWRVVQHQQLPPITAGAG
ncbi:MAG: nuclear transport factor 2 family protein [Pseudomonadota bacterium]